MGLMCGCDFDAEPGMIFTYIPDDYELMDAKKRQRCLSCNELIDVGAIAARVARVRIPQYEVECKIYGEDGEIPIADKWLCERCADICFSLSELGYCVNPHDDMRELVREYAQSHALTQEPK